MNDDIARTEKPALIGYLPPLGGIPKTRAAYNWHRNLINIGDICYTYPGTLIAAGSQHAAWNFSTSAEEVNETYSRVIFFIPCRIAPPPYDKDGYPFETVTRFIEKLKIPFVSVSESIQSSAYEYENDFHKKIGPAVSRYLHTIADHSVSVGTRGTYSAEILGKLGIKNVEVVGCPSLYINGPELDEKLARTPDPNTVRNVAMCYSNYQKLERSRVADLLNMADQYDFHYVEQSFNLLVKAQHYPGLIEMGDLADANTVFHGLDSIRSLYRKDRIRYFTNYRLWKDFLAGMDFVFGARMHGLTPAIHSGIPALFIAHDARVREMCDFFDLPYIAESDIPDNADLDFFCSRCDYTRALSSYPEKYFAFLEFLEKNGIRPNVRSDGTIKDHWLPEPSPVVVSSEKRKTNDIDANFLDLLCSLAEQRISSNDARFDRCVRDIAQSWYDTRVAQGTAGDAKLV